MSWQDFWNANIFHPDPLALTFSEHLFGQSLQILPIYWMTGNIILCYNLVFLSTFALSALGTYLLVRDLLSVGTAKTVPYVQWAAFFAGLIYGFLPYRVASIPHVQVMSAQWMPFALFGLNRLHRHAGSYRALAGGTAALVMQNWSCGYYLLYFAPFAPLFVVYRMWIAGRLRDVRMWIAMIGAAAVTLVLTIPFLAPYLEAQQRFGFERPFGEVVFFSANVWSYITAAEPVRMWGKILRFYPHGEGETFLGFVPVAPRRGRAIAAAVLEALAEKRPRSCLTPQLPRRDPVSASPRPDCDPGLAVITQVVAVASAVIFGGFDTSVFGIALARADPAAVADAVGRRGRACCWWSRRAFAASPRACRGRRPCSSWA